MDVLMEDLRDIDLSRLLTLYAVHGGASRCLDTETAERLERVGLVALERSDEGWVIEARVTPRGARVATGMLAAVGPVAMNGVTDVG